MTEPIKLPPAWNHPNETPESYAAKCVQHATATLSAEVERLRADAADFHMTYRMKCDEETKAQAVEVEKLREACQTLVTLPDAEDWLAALHLAVTQARSALKETK